MSVRGQSFTQDLGLWLQVDERSARGGIQLDEHGRVHGTERARLAVPLILADTLIGAHSFLSAAPRIPLTVEMSARMLATPELGPLEAHSRLLARSEATCSSECRVYDQRGCWIAVVHARFLVPASRHELSGVTREGGITRATREPTTRLTQGLAEQLGVEVPRPGEARIAVVPYVRQEAGLLHGAVLALLAERAAETALSQRTGDRHTTRSIDLHYLGAVREDPAVAGAQIARVGSSSASCRVEIRDEARDRLATVAMLDTFRL